VPWGYDPFLQQHFANQDFVCNMLAYMRNEEGLIHIENKTLKMWLLDQAKIAQERRWWQRVIESILRLGLLGMLWNDWYKHTYTR
jgi:hypothetical protein